MAEATITEESIRAALTERLKATHVEIQDMSGTPPIPRSLCPDVIRQAEGRLSQAATLRHSLLQLREGRDGCDTFDKM